MSKKKPELVHTNQWLKEFFRQGCRTHRYVDAGRVDPYDGHIFVPHGPFVPFEAKFQRGGLTFSVDRWRNGLQGHQYKELIKDYERGAHAVFVVFHLPNKQRSIEARCIKIQDLPLDRVELKSMKIVNTVKDLLEL